MKQVIDKIYNGAWNNLELSKGSKNAVNTSGAIIGLGLLAAIVILNRK